MTFFIHECVFISVEPVIRFSQDAPVLLNEAPQASGSKTDEDANPNVSKKTHGTKRVPAQPKQSQPVDEKKKKISYPIINFKTPTPELKNLKIEELRKLAYCAQIEKDQATRVCTEAITNFLPYAEDFWHTIHQ